jgi:hypothetical protein
MRELKELSRSMIALSEECSGMTQFAALSSGPFLRFNFNPDGMIQNPMREEVTLMTWHYKVEARIDGKWFSNEFVFETQEEANAYGEGMLDAGGADKFRLKETMEPVKLPQEA